MQQRRLTVTVAILAAIAILALHPVFAQGGSPSEAPSLSPYWKPVVSRWEDIVLHYAQERGLDPDLVASVIWKESRGRATSRGPAGAVGLMGVMPFEWRPSPEELENPWTNVFWGARALAHTIRDGRGDIYYSLAAYNGGWEKVHNSGPRNYATDVLSNYALAVAVRSELPIDNGWAAIFAAEGVPGPRTITVIRPGRPAARYTERPCAQDDIPSVPADIPPQATVITYVDEQGVEGQVNMWLITEDSLPPMPLAEQDISSSPPAAHERTELELLDDAPMLQGTPVPVSAGEAVVLSNSADLRPGASTWWHARTTLPVGTVLELIGYDPDFSNWVYVRTADGASAGWAQTKDLGIDCELGSLPLVTPVPTLTPTPTPTPTPAPPAECQGGPLHIDAWPLEKAFLPTGGWKVTIFVEGHGGNCIYTYAWEGEIQGGPMNGSMTFEVSHTDTDAFIMGTVSVTSAGETAETGLFMRPTGED